MSATKEYLKEHEPEAIRKERENREAETALAILNRNIEGREILDGQRSAVPLLADLCRRMGYIGGVRGRCDDFNQGVLFAAHLIVDALGADNRERFIALIASSEAKAHKQPTK
jgi:hypothetical protein